MHNLVALRQKVVKVLWTWIRNRAWLWLVLLVFLIIVGLVNPVREMAMDDDWAYALTVRHLLETGQYRLNDWASANMVAQTYWGALFASALGYSFTALRMSTLVLLAFGLAAFYTLLRDRGLHDDEAGILTLALLSCPLVIRLGFTFMTDVQFLAWLIIALWLYARALRAHSYPTIFLASVAAAAAVGTRQFGMVIIAGLIGAWLLDRKRWRNTVLYGAGLVLPVLMATWQLWVGFVQPTFYMTINLGRQSSYLRNVPQLLVEVLWRPTVILQYLGLFLLPLMPLLIWTSLRPHKIIVWKQLSERLTDLNPRQRLFLSGSVVYVIAGVVYGYIERGALMPSLPWNLDLLRRSYAVVVFLTLVTAACAMLLGWLLTSKVLRQGLWRTRAPVTSFLVVTGVALLGLQLIYVQFGDEYLIAFLPLVILALGRFLQDWSRRFRSFAAGFCLLALIASTLWTRGVLAQQQAFWQGAEAIRLMGVPPAQIYATWTWSSYNSAFQDWIAHVKDQEMIDASAFFKEWLPQRKSQAEYWVVSSLTSPAGEHWQILDTIQYRGIDLRNRNLYVVKRGEK